jgi:hypothetical protein
MKRTGFQNKPRKPLKRSGFKQRTTPLKTKSSSPRKKQLSTLPKWIKAIPEGSHGSGTYQKRLWKLVSDYCRIRDWYKYDGYVVDKPERVEHWSQGDGGHFLPYSKCNGMFKFSPDNVHLQSKSGNAWGGSLIGFPFGKELERRYGNYYIPMLHEKNKAHHNQIIRTADILIAIDKMLDLMEDLPEHPEYYKRVLELKLSTD